MGNDYYLTPEDFETAEKNGIPYETAYRRFYKAGWKKIDAITRPVRGRTVWQQYKELCDKNGVTLTCFYNRIRRGITPEVAATTQPRKHQWVFRKPQISNEMIAQAVAKGINKNTFVCRVYNYGWSVEKAMNEPVKTKHSRKTKRGETVAEV